MTIDYVKRCRLRLTKKEFDDFLQFCADELKPEGHDITQSELSLVFVDRNEGQALNSQYRGKDYATDVLSFASEVPGHLGELVFCHEVVEKKSRENELSVTNQYLYLILHGILHLLGYEHETNDEDAHRMFTVQDRIFDKYLK